MNKMRVILVLLAFAASITAAGAADGWPSKSIKLIVPFSAGGSADTLGRLFAQVLSESLGQHIVVENRPGAGGMTASAQVAKAEPDGYTLLVSGVASHAIAPALNSNAGYDPVRDFTHIVYLGGPPTVWVAHPSMKATTLKSLIELIRASSNPIPYASPGPGTQGHLLASYFAHKEGLALQHVPYKGAGPAMSDLIAGHVKLGSLTWTTALGHIQTGTVVPIAITAEDRLTDFPNVPTFKELGYPDMVATTWFSISGPAGIPTAIVDRLNRGFVDALSRADVQARLKQEGIAVTGMDAAAFTKFVEGEVGRWSAVAKLSGLTTQAPR
jgi:tripartite-type tricarboxylate transporter receptor subunit TctC